VRLIPKNWASFQHYKDRNPPWIKLHKGLLNDRAYTRLPLASKALAPLLWLLASESKDGSFNADVEEIAFRLRMSEKEVSQGLSPLIKAGFFIEEVSSASNALAGCQQVAPESCSETETETETKAEAPAGAFVLPEWIPAEAWAGYVEMRSKKKGGAMTVRARNLKVAELQKFQDAGHDLAAILDKSTANSWTDIYEPKGNPSAKQESYV
jgi:biotin operon repressor